MSYKNIKYKIKNYLFKKFWPYECYDRDAIFFLDNSSIVINKIRFNTVELCVTSKISFLEEINIGLKIREIMFDRMKRDIINRILNLIPEPVLYNKDCVNGYSEFIIKYPVFVKEE
jgi:hypothetical protein